MPTLVTGPKPRSQFVVVLKLAPLVRLDDEQLFEFCQLNRDLRIERDAEGALVLMAPVGGASSARNLEFAG